LAAQADPAQIFRIDLIEINASGSEPITLNNMTADDPQTIELL
jgi:hypothetical protein